MGKSKKAEPDAKPKRSSGYLSCNGCGRSVAFQGFGDAKLDGPWPMHRCGWEVRAFDRWTVDDPNHSELPKAVLP